MALTLGDNFSYQGAKPLDARLKYNTLADMKAVADATMYDGCMAYCAGTDKTYQWKSTNSVDETTGRWREFSSGGGGGSYTAGDGILIENNEISTDNMQEGDMDDIVTPSPQPFGGIDLDDIQDVDLSNLTNGQVLKYDSTTQKWKNGEGGGTTINSLGDIADVDLTSLTDGQMLQWDATNSKWVNVNAPSGDTSTCYKTDDSAETTLADDDYIPFYDTSATDKKKSLWSNIKSVLKTYFDSIYDTAPTILTQTLTTGATSVTFNDASITSTAIVDVYTSKAGLNYTSINDSVANTLVITYDAQDSDVVVKLSVR